MNRTGYQNYGKFLKQVGQLNHQSCLMLTTTQMPKAVTYLSGKGSPVRTLTLGGLGKSAESLLQDRELLNPSQYLTLIQQYNGNPQALQIVAKTIRNLFNNRVADFLAINYNSFLGDFSDTLAQQLNRLSLVEQNTLSILVSIKNPVVLRNLKPRFQPNKIPELMQALESLERRSLISIIQTQQDTFYQPNRLISDYLNTAKATSQNEFLISVLKPLS